MACDARPVGCRHSLRLPPMAKRRNAGLGYGCCQRGGAQSDWELAGVIVRRGCWRWRAPSWRLPEPAATGSVAVPG